MTFLPPPPGPMANPPASGFAAPAPARPTADSQAARLTIPYLGPQPPPSRATSVALLVACGATAVLYLVRAVVFLRQAGIEQQFLDQRTAAAARHVQSGTDLLSTLSVLSLLAIGVLVLLEVIWRFQRRPRQARTELGEAYVEFPMKWVVPIPLRVVSGLLILAGFVTSSAGSTTSSTLATDFPHHRQLLALGNVAWAGAFVVLAAWVVVANRSHDQRVAWSAPYRADSSQVPFFPPVAGAGFFESSTGSRSGGGGIVWMISTMGLILAVFVGVPALIGGLVELSHARADGVLWTAIGVGLLAMVAWVMRRRYQLGKL